MHTLSLLSEDYAFSHFAAEFKSYCASNADQAVLEMLEQWTLRDKKLSETRLESGLLSHFFRKLWGYHGSGEERGQEYTLLPRCPIPRAGAGGQTGIADLALGLYGREATLDVPQVIAEFKDIRSALDSPQHRKGNSRSPIKQLFDYLRHADEDTDSRSAVRPTWGIATDMSEFRLYLRRFGESQYQRFIIEKKPGDRGPTLLDHDEAGAAQRFLFSIMFHRNMLVSSGGPSALEQLLEQQWVQEKDLEKTFYVEYSKFRERLFQALVDANPDFSSRKLSLLRATQRLIDRFIFLLFCEDMGEILRFPKDLVRNLLARASTDPYFDEHADDLWRRIQRLFATLAHGGSFAGFDIPAFNGGLFIDDHDLDALTLPNHVFCSRNQGASAEALLKPEPNLLHLSACYNFGERGVPRRRTIGLHTLGRIFEQSITDLEVMEADAEGRESLTRLSKRKRDGVYYTPEWVSAYIVEEVVGLKLNELRAQVALLDPTTITDAEISKWQKAGPKTKGKTLVGRYLDGLVSYEQAIEQISILDPACGSGAFLIQALRRLIQERRWIAQEWERVSAGSRRVFDYDESIRATLSKNLYGVDINAESVEITKLALWLHTAQPSQPLMSLDHNIRVGNSLIGPDFSDFFSDTQIGLFAGETEERRETINVFDWQAAFPEVFARGGFDCIIGNPPYVKYQHLRQVDEVIADYLRAAKLDDGAPRYRSTSNGNFDLYLAFIEKGIQLLNPKGRLGYIAPSIWIKQEYGRGLCQYLHEGGHLERWLDFGDYQIFEGVSTYTALQFYTAKKNAVVEFAARAGADLSDLMWQGQGATSIGYEQLSPEGPWVFAANDELELIRRLKSSHPTLGKSVRSISVGVQTSADKIYHLEHLSRGRYRDREGRVYEIEAELMRPLLSGQDVRPYEKPRAAMHILFPYVAEGDRVVMIDAAEMERSWPKAWAYLRGHERALRGREKGKFDDDLWYRFGRNQNIDKQHLPKILVPRMVSRLCAAPDEQGEYVADNVDVCFLLPKKRSDLWYLVGLLNSPVLNYVFKRQSKPFRNGYLSANKQYISSLPIPAPMATTRRVIAKLAKSISALSTNYRAKILKLQSWLESPQVRVVERGPEWIWTDLRSPEAWKQAAPEALRGQAKRSWARQKSEEDLERHIGAWSACLGKGPVRFAVDGGEIHVLDAEGSVIQSGIFVAEEEAEFVAAQWNADVRGRSLSARELVSVLCRLRVTNATLRAAVTKLDREIRELDQRIAAELTSLDEASFDLYDVSEVERRLILADQ